MRRAAFLAIVIAACATPRHARLEKQEIAGERFVIEDLLAKPVDVLVLPGDGPPDLLVHFHGASWVAFQAAAATRRRPLVVAVVNLGAGSSVYERPFADPAMFDRLAARTGTRFARRYISAFSAGYGAVRAILRGGAKVDGVLLLDGLHTSYVGGKVDPAAMAPFVAYAQSAALSENAFIVTHSEIYPGTYASTTETADDLLQSLDLRRRRLHGRGPAGMRQLSEARRGRFTVLGFAGNSAPDHVDHLHGMPRFLERLFDR